MNKFQTKHAKLINSSGGLVDGIFVEKVGVMLMKKSTITEDAKNIFNIMNIDTNRSDSEQHAEFNSRITYLSFNDDKTDSSEYNRNMIEKHGHRSVYNDEIVTFLIAGSSIETLMEFIAHNEPTVARLTSSKTNSQNDCLYRIRTQNIEQEFIDFQKELVCTYLEKVRGTYNDPDIINTPFKKEVFNIMNLGNKAVSFTITMSVKDWHKTFIGRLSEYGVESEMLEILNDVADILKEHYPLFFNSKEEYYEMNNSKKYEQK